MGAHLPWLHFSLLRVVQNVETYAYTTAAIHTQGKKAYSNATPYRACFSARLSFGTAGLRGILRPAWPDLGSTAELLAAATALKDGGVSGIAFYNWGHLRQANVQWIAEAVAAFGGRS